MNVVRFHLYHPGLRVISQGGSLGKGSGCVHLNVLGNSSQIPWWLNLVKNVPAMQETWVLFLVWEDFPETGTATHSSVLAWRIPWTVCIVHGITKSWT